MKINKIYKKAFKIFDKIASDAVYWNHKELRDAAFFLRQQNPEIFRGKDPQEILFIVRKSMINYLAYSGRGGWWPPEMGLM